MTVRLFLLLVFTMLLWAGTFISARLLAGEATPSVSAFLRFTIASLSLIGIILISGKSLSLPPKKAWFPLIILGATGVFAYNICFFNGLRYINAGHASLFIASTPLVIIFITILTGMEKASLRKIIGVLISLLGTVLVITNGHPLTFPGSGSFGMGEIFLLGCVASWSAFTLAGRLVLRHLSPLHTICWTSIVGSAMLFPLACRDGLLTSLPTLPWQVWANVVYLGVFGTAVGFSLYYQGIETAGASRAGIFINLVPVFSVLLSWMLLGEAVHLVVLFGGVLVLSGVSLASFPSQQAEPLD
ncbi:DMT family transporter [Desulforhopalus vacuolatus]|uniref:DMT family transporter n=1 Tax=Desulforhopalus vacuolatus TaxID=40414 RepID=UPI001963BDE8|nr:DMT family transporter [Desulforhopalus vacuolatus]MBM9518317.1 DMT family transporter [Desulforhopalus vacuolatus]